MLRWPYSGALSEVTRIWLGGELMVLLHWSREGSRQLAACIGEVRPAPQLGGASKVWFLLVLPGSTRPRTQTFHYFFERRGTSASRDSA